MIPLIVIASVIAFILISFLIFLFYLYRVTFYSPLGDQNNDHLLTEATKELCDEKYITFLIDRMLSIPYEDVFISSYDKKKLHARVYKKESDTVVLMLHGYRGTSRRDFSLGAYEMLERGNSVILVDERAHASSGGHTITFGIKERKDVINWLKYIKDTFGNDKRIVLVGISMGGATSLFSSDLLSEKDKVVADCPYTNPKEIIYLCVKKMYPRINTKFLYNMLYLSLFIYGRTSLGKEEADKHIDNAKCKILIIHGSGDTLIPYQMSYRLKEKYPDKIEYLLIKDAEHGLSCVKDSETYLSTIDKFLAK